MKALRALAAWSSALVLTMSAATASATPSVTVLHINGINTVASEAMRAVVPLRNAALTSLNRISADCPQLSYHWGDNFHVGLIYNRTGETGGGTVDASGTANFWADFKELTTSKTLEEQWLPQLLAATNHGELVLAALAAQQSYTLEAPAIQAVVEEGYARIANLVMQGQKVVLSSHSQGATIANRIYFKLLLNLSEDQVSQVQFLNFGSAANFQPPGESLTFSNDDAIKVALFNAGRVISRPTCGAGLECPFNALPDSGVADDLLHWWPHHSFTQSYMGQQPLPDLGASAFDLATGMMERALRKLLASDCHYEDHAYRHGIYAGRYVSSPPGLVGELELAISAAGVVRVSTPETGSGTIDSHGTVHFTAENPGRPGMQAVFTGSVQGLSMRGTWSGILRLDSGDVQSSGTWEAVLQGP